MPCRGVAQWLARFVRDEEAGGSNPLTPTIFPLFSSPFPHFPIPFTTDSPAVGAMAATQSVPWLLQFSDSLTGRRAALRIEPADGLLTARQLLDKYLRDCPAAELLRAGAITADALPRLRGLTDLVYRCDEQGRLGDWFSGLVLRQQGQPVDMERPPVSATGRVGDTEVAVIDLCIDRANGGYHRNWVGFHRRRWDADPDFFDRFVRDTLAAEYGAADAETVLRLDSGDGQRRLVKALGRRIWRSDFENYSRFVGDKLMFKTGDETVRNIAAGSGGICTEKVQALKFLTDHYGLESEYLIAGDKAVEPAPVDKLRELLTTFDFRFAKRYMRYWQHTALLYYVDGAPLLVDATNGNIPFLFAQGSEVEAMLGDRDKRPVRVQMVETVEDYYYHRVPQDIPQNLFFAMEGWLGDTDMAQVFENELGLYLSAEFYVTPLPYRSEPEYQRLRREYRGIAGRAGFAGEVNREWTLDSPLGRQLTAAEPAAAAKILAAQEHLLHRYNEWDKPGHSAGLVIFRFDDRAGKGESRE